MYTMSFTLDTSHPPIGRLNADAPWNASAMSVTDDTSQPEMSPLNPSASKNACLRLVSWLTFHATASSHGSEQCATASLSS